MSADKDSPILPVYHLLILPSVHAWTPLNGVRATAVACALICAGDVPS
jgi:hypothetical protein